MCRPSCCGNSRGQGTGIAAVAVILLGAFIVAKIGPIVASIIHAAVEVIGIAVLAAGAVLAFTVTVWLAVMIVRWWLHHHGPRRQAVLQPARTAAWQHMAAGGPPGCLACGGSGRVLHAISGARYQRCSCPVCEPARLAG